jgi:hypothetical protein
MMSKEEGLCGSGVNILRLELIDADLRDVFQRAPVDFLQIQVTLHIISSNVVG